MARARLVLLHAAALAAMSLVPACSDGSVSIFEAGGDAAPGTGGFDAAAGDGGAPGTFGEGGTLADTGAPSTGVLTATIRDFKLYAAADPSTNPDFENVPPGDGWDDRDIVGPALGTDGKPVYKSTTGGKTLTTHGKAAFDAWYRDVPGTNLSVAFPMPLLPNADGSFSYDSNVNGVPLSAADPRKMFFPIDDGGPHATAFGNQGDPHNYSFTLELHTAFTYKGGEVFSFRGDDDVFVYIDDALVIDVGGIHVPEQAEIQIDTLKLVKGTEHRLDFFSAERHKTYSNILFTTTLGLRPAPPR
jgi:fibro-slime domain-containing protein